MRIDDLMITIAYFSIPIQLLVSLYKYPRLSAMPIHVLILAILFALFILLCGVGHLLRCLNVTDSISFRIVNICTAIVSMTTAIYLLPLIPNLMSSLDTSLQTLVDLNKELEDSQRKLKTFMAFLCHEIRNPLFAITSVISFLEEDESNDDEKDEKKDETVIDDTDCQRHRYHQEQGLKSIKQNANLMLRLVNDVLDIQKLESGKLEMECIPFDLHELLSGIATEVEHRMSQIDTVQFHMTDLTSTSSNDGSSSSSSSQQQEQQQVPPVLPQIVVSDSARILQIVYNLLSNAMKFTEQGSISFDVTTMNLQDALEQGFVVNAPQEHPSVDKGSSSSSSSNGSTMSTSTTVSSTSNSPQQQDNMCNAMEQGEVTKKDELSVSNPSSNNKSVLKLVCNDTGIGIDPEQLHKLFIPYSQCKLSDYRKYGGTGLGLSIIARLVKRMNGTIHVDSIPNVGTTFTVYIPIGIVQQSQPSSSSSDTPPSSSSLSSSNRRPSSEKKHSYTKNLTLPDMTGQELLVNYDFMDTKPSPSSSPPPSSSKKVTTNLSTTRSIMTDKQKKEEQEQEETPLLLPLMNPVMSASSSSPSLVTLFDDQPSHHPQQQPVLPNSEEKVVLVVDDNAINRKIICRMLTQFGIKHEQASDGVEAVSFMIHQSRNVTKQMNHPIVGLILMDLNMPNMDGIDATYEIIHKYKISVPIIALTAHALDENRNKAMDAGAIEFQTKPILRETLQRRCRYYLN